MQFLKDGVQTVGIYDVCMFIILFFSLNGLFIKYFYILSDYWPKCQGTKQPATPGELL